MLRIVIPAVEGFDDEKQEFTTIEKEQVLELEHSLISLSKWESKWCKVFLSKEEKTTEQTIDYIKCMTVTPRVDPSVYDRLTTENIKQIQDYIAAPMTATYFAKDAGGKTNREQVTSELIYYWMIAMQIPFECEKWHLNRLLTLIRVCNIKNQPPKKMSKQEIMAQNAALNAKRRQQFNTTG